MFGRTLQTFPRERFVASDADGPEVNDSYVALADPTRRAICQRLAHGRATVGQLASLFPMSRPAVSQHLRVLKEAGLIRTESHNRLSAYELVPAAAAGR